MLGPDTPGNSCMGGTEANPLTAAGATGCRPHILSTWPFLSPIQNIGLGQRCALGSAHDGLFIWRVSSRALNGMDISAAPDVRSQRPERIPKLSPHSELCTSQYARAPHGRRCLGAGRHERLQHQCLKVRSCSCTKACLWRSLCLAVSEGFASLHQPQIPCKGIALSRGILGLQRGGGKTSLHYFVSFKPSLARLPAFGTRDTPTADQST